MRQSEQYIPVASKKQDHAAGGTNDIRGGAQLMRQHFARLWACCLAGLLLASCGGGGSEATGATTIRAEPIAATVPTSSVATSPMGVSRLIVAGDSLADVGTFGFKSTIQDSANPAGFPVFPDLVGATFGLPAGCSHYVQERPAGSSREEILHARTLPSAVPVSSAATVRRAFLPSCAMLPRRSVVSSARATWC